MRFAYADPPYPGLAYHYGEKELDHAVLIALLESHFPDGWALSTSSRALRKALPLCPANTRVMAWVKPWCSFKPGQSVFYAWEPLLVRGGRRRPKTAPFIRDWVACQAATKRDFFGAKPKEFCNWIFAVLGMVPDDEFVDIFPGSGAVTRAWEAWQRQLPLILETQCAGTNPTSMDSSNGTTGSRNGRR